MQSKLIGNLSGVHGVLSRVTPRQYSSHLKKCIQSQETHRQILLVSEDQEQSIPELVLVQHPLKLLTGFADTLPIVGIDDEDDSLGVLEVMAPEGTDLILTTDIPHGERNVLVLDSLDVEAYGWRKV